MKKLLIVEGNLREENISFSGVGIQTHTESLKDSLEYYSKNLNIDVFNPCSEKSFDKILPNINKYDGLTNLIASSIKIRKGKINKTLPYYNFQKRIACATIVERPVCYEILDEVAVHDTFRWMFLMKKKRRVDLFSLLFSSLLSNTCLKNIKKLCVYSYGY